MLRRSLRIETLSIQSVASPLAGDERGPRATHERWRYIVLGGACPVPESQAMLDAMAGEIFELYRLVAIARSRRPAGPDDLSETEFLTLDVLAKEQPLTIGDVQKRIGVVPAQMSRIVRALEEQGGRSYVECKINPPDRRRVDVSLTPAGKAAYEVYRSARLGSMRDILCILDPGDRGHFMDILRQIRDAFEQRLTAS